MQEETQDNTAARFKINVPHRQADTIIIITSVAEPEPVLFGRSRCEGPAPGSGSTLDKTEEILNDILFVCSNMD